MRRFARFGTICVQFKKHEKKQGGVIFLVELQVEACDFNKSNTPPWGLFTFLKLYKFENEDTRLTSNTPLHFRFYF